MNIIEAKDYDEICKIAANYIARQLIAKPCSTLGLATGSSPIGVYDRLVDYYNDGLIDFSGSYTFNLDEYVGLGRAHRQSYYYYMKKKLFNKINIPRDHIHIPNGLSKDSDKECMCYDECIRARGGIDLQLLGLGHNGHIGFNEPSSKFSGGTHKVALSDSTRRANARFFAEKSEVPSEAYTVGIKTIMQSKSIIMIVSGRDKRDILSRVINGEVDPRVPATVLQLHPFVTIIADKEALSK